MTVLENLDYADNIGLLSNKHQDAQEKAERLSNSQHYWSQGQHKEDLSSEEED